MVAEAAVTWAALDMALSGQRDDHPCISYYRRKCNPDYPIPTTPPMKLVEDAMVAVTLPAVRPGVDWLEVK